MKDKEQNVFNTFLNSINTDCEDGKYPCNCIDKEKQIEEMAKVIFNTCAWRFGKPDDYKEIFNDIAEDLTKLKYQKLPEDSVVLKIKELEDTCKYCPHRKNAELNKDSVVLSREEYKNIYEQAEQNVLANIVDGGTSCHWCIEQHEKKAIKETGEKFARDIFNHITTPEVWEKLRQLWLSKDGNFKANKHIYDLLIEPIAKQFGVEIKE